MVGKQCHQYLLLLIQVSLHKRLKYNDQFQDIVFIHYKTAGMQLNIVSNETLAHMHMHMLHTLKYRQYIIQIFALFDVNKQVIYLQVDFASLSIETQ